MKNTHLAGASRRFAGAFLRPLFHRSCGALVASTLLAALATGPRARALSPTEARGYYDVTLHGVTRNSSSAATANTTAINNAIKYARDNGLVVYFPQGTYYINGPLDARSTCYNAPINPGIYQDANECYKTLPDPLKPRSVVMVGETVASGARPVIKLATGSSGFGSATAPKVVVYFRNFHNSGNYNTNGDFQPGYPESALDSKEQPQGGYFQMFRGIDIDCGSNAGAIGLYFNQAQDSSVENVKVYGASFHTGIRGLPGRAWGAINIEVQGGKYGLDTTPFGPKGENGKSNFMSMVAGLKLSGQSESPIRHPGQSLTVAGFDITFSQASKPVIQTVKGFNEADQDYTTEAVDVGAINLVDGTINLPASGYTGIVISNGDPTGTGAARNIHLHNVYITGMTGSSINLAQSDTLPVRTSGALANSTKCRLLSEYNYCNEEAIGVADRLSNNLVNGARSRGETYTAPTTVDLSSKPADLLARHIPGRLPAVEDADAVDFMVASGLAFNASGEVSFGASVLNNILAANPKVFMPKGVYKINGTVTLREDTVLFGAARHLTRLETNWTTPPTIETTFIKTESDAGAITYLGDLAIGVKSDLLANDFFTALEWRAGRNSMLHIARPYHWPRTGALPTNPHSLVKITGQGGGRWYFFGRGQNDAMTHNGYRILTVDKTGGGATVPLWLYGLNLEHAMATSATGIKFAEFKSAQNMRIYAVKTEVNNPPGATKCDPDPDQAPWAFNTYTTYLSFDKCKNVGVFGYGGIREVPVPGFGPIEFTGTSGSDTSPFLVTNVLPQLKDTATGGAGFIVKEAIGTTYTATLGWQDSGPVALALSLYKRGAITEGAMVHQDIGYAPVPAGWFDETTATAPTTLGSAYYNPPPSGTLLGTFALAGAGPAITTTSEAIGYLAGPAATNTTQIVARVVQVDGPSNSSRAGVMVRASTANNSAFVFLSVQKDGKVIVKSRTATGGTVATSASLSTTAEWVRLTCVRNGSNVITSITPAYSSNGGVTWTNASVVNGLSMAASSQFALVTNSESTTALANAVFDNVDLIP